MQKVEQAFTEYVNEIRVLLTLTETEEAGREEGGAEESQEDRATDELKASVLPLGTKPLANAIQSQLQIPIVEEDKRLLQSSCLRCW